MPHPDRARRPAGRRRVVVAVGRAVLLVGVLLVGTVVGEGVRILAGAGAIAEPGPPVPVMVLGGDRARVETALALTGVAKGTRRLIASADAARDLVELGGDCAAAHVRCVDPVPATTRGEARLAAALAAAAGWDRLVVVTSWWHVHRAAQHLAACLEPLGVAVTMVPAGDPTVRPGPLRLAEEVLGGIDARLRPECAGDPS